MTPTCDKCGRSKIQPGRYADWRCSCCDESAKCPHVSFVTRLMRRMAGRRA
ncbi:MAG: hypothetical protein ABR548_08980 [Actinomycetota bacterium]|nr:hypothetical protein [Actinomycetota bacterium]